MDKRNEKGEHRKRIDGIVLAALARGAYSRYPII